MSVQVARMFRQIYAPLPFSLIYYCQECKIDNDDAFCSKCKKELSIFRKRSLLERRKRWRRFLLTAYANQNYQERMGGSGSGQEDTNNYLLTEDGEVITTESGEGIIIE